MDGREASVLVAVGDLGGEMVEYAEATGNCSGQVS
jgi:hypothetical protein